MMNEENNNIPQEDSIELKEEKKKEEILEHHDHSGDKKEKSPKSKHGKDEKVMKLEEELSAMNDKFLRLYSEYDNYRKRTLKEKIELSKTATSEVIMAILPVIDDFERAIKAFQLVNEVPAAFKDGMILIFNKFVNILGQQGLEPIKSVGEEFNTDFHEAITNTPSTLPEQKGKVVDEIEKGYLLNGKVIRFAKVVVGC
jgi:molecular chaperone GrpE